MEGIPTPRGPPKLVSTLTWLVIIRLPEILVGFLFGSITTEDDRVAGLNSDALPRLILRLLCKPSGTCRVGTMGRHFPNPLVIDVGLVTGEICCGTPYSSERSVKISINSVHISSSGFSVGEESVAIYSFVQVSNCKDKYQALR